MRRYVQEAEAPQRTQRHGGLAPDGRGGHTGGQAALQRLRLWPRPARRHALQPRPGQAGLAPADRTGRSLSGLLSLFRTRFAERRGQLGAGDPGKPGEPNRLSRSDAAATGEPAATARTATRATTAPGPSRPGAGRSGRKEPLGAPFFFRVRNRRGAPLRCPGSGLVPSPPYSARQRLSWGSTTPMRETASSGDTSLAWAIIGAQNSIISSIVQSAA